MNISEKLKLIRKANNLTQADFANSIGVSRGNLTNIELGKVEPTHVFINCVALMYNIDKNWLLDDKSNDLSALNGSTNMVTLIVDKYEQLDDKYKKFVEAQITQLLELQGKNKDWQLIENRWTTMSDNTLLEKMLSLPEFTIIDLQHNDYDIRVYVSKKGIFAN